MIIKIGDIVRRKGSKVQWEIVDIDTKNYDNDDRIFLDIANRVNPSLCRGELERREKVMMWKAIEGGKKEEIEKARERLKRYSAKNEKII